MPRLVAEDCYRRSGLLMNRILVVRRFSDGTEDQEEKRVVRPAVAFVGFWTAIVGGILATFVGSAS